SSNPAKPSSEPLDPQGNWLFTIQNQGGDTLTLAGLLFELNPPTVTSIGFATPVNDQLLCFGSFKIGGEASGTDSISLTVQQTDVNLPISIALTGTIAADQEHMSGSFATNTSSGCFIGSGTWSARLLTPLTGDWTGTMSNATTNLSVTASLIENTDQTTSTMGQV